MCVFRVFRVPAGPPFFVPSLMVTSGAQAGARKLLTLGGQEVPGLVHAQGLQPR